MGLPSDSLAFFAADLGITYQVDLTTTTAHSVKLPPGLYVVQALSYAGGAARVWAAARAFEAGRLNDVAAAVPFFPMDEGGPVSKFEIAVKAGVNDQVSGRTDAGTASLFITCIERTSSAKKARLG